MRIKSLLVGGDIKANNKKYDITQYQVIPLRPY